MGTNQFWTAENIRAVASLWPLALIIFLTLLLLSILVFFRSQVQKFFDTLKNLTLKYGKSEIALNQSQLVKSEPEKNMQEAAVSASQSEKKGYAESEIKKTETKDVNEENEMYLCIWSGKLEEAEIIFQKLQAATTDSDERINRECMYLKERFEKGDFAAQVTLQDLARRLEETRSSKVSLAKMADAMCYAFSRNYTKAILTFKDAAKCSTNDVSRANNLSFAAKNLYIIDEKAEAFELLKSSLTVRDTEAKIKLLTTLADLYGQEGDTFGRLMALQRALSFKPNSKKLLFDTAYACSEAEFYDLAVLHYEKLVEIEPNHQSAFNNLGVAFGRLNLPSLAIKNYKLAMENGETLAAANFAFDLIDAGALDEAEKILDEAKTKKEVHQNVMSAVVKLETVKKNADESHQKGLSLANAQYRYLLEFADAMLMATNGSFFALDGEWSNDESSITFKQIDTETGDVEFIWNAPKREKFKFSGKIFGLGAKGKVEKTSLYSSLLLTEKQESNFVAFGEGFAQISNDEKRIQVFIQENDSQKHSITEFHKI